MRVLLRVKFRLSGLFLLLLVIIICWEVRALVYMMIVLYVRHRRLYVRRIQVRLIMPLLLMEVIIVTLTKENHKQPITGNR